MAEALDFQIDTMQFRLATDNTYYSATNTGRRYVRSTAPFRKDQIDTSGQAGDQSLAGWWTRGQLSFHKGAGVKYYEVLDGSDVLNRFQTSEHIEPFTPGEVTLGHQPNSSLWQLGATASAVLGVSTASNGNMAWVENVSTGAQFVTGTDAGLRDGVVTVTGTPTRYVTSGGGGISYGVVTANDGIAELPSGTLLYSKSDGALNGLWYAKDRMWATDTNGRVYALAPKPSTTPQAIVATDAIFQATDSADTEAPWSFAASPSAVFFGIRSRVYGVTPDNSGSVPTLTSGVVAAELAPGEHITAMAYLLGYVVLSTTSGVRVAQVEQGGLVVGPLVIRGKGAGRDLGAVGSNVYALVEDIDGEVPGVRLARINLETLVSPLVPAWDSTSISIDAGSTISKGVTSSTGYVVVYGVRNSSPLMEAWGRPQDALVTQGSITTGLHRLGTLEPKSFQYLRVKTEGTVGSVSVDALLPDGTSAPVGTVAAGGSAELPLTSAVPTPQEYVGFKFTLTGDGTSGPVLLGYQLKALPVPKRQRVLQVPLLLRDVIRLKAGTTKGHEGKAWEDLQALEALESSKAIVPFTDFRTGETGSAYIDGIEFNGDIETAQNHKRTFGGIAYVELRVIS